MSQNSDELSEFQRAQVDFLKREVNRCIDESLRRDKMSGADTRLYYARDNLKRYVEQLRQLGKRI